MKFGRPHHLQADEHRPVGSGVEEEGSGSADEADHQPGHSRSSDPGQVECGAVQRDRVRQIRLADHLDGEGLPGRVVDHGRQAEREREQVDVPGTDDAGDGQHTEDDGERAHRGLGGE